MKVMVSLKFAVYTIYTAEFCPSVVQQYELCDREKVDVLDLNIS